MGRGTGHVESGFFGLFERRWAVPLLAELEASGGGARLVTLAHRTGAGRATARQSIEHLVRLGVVAENPGHGHPLRPEFVLTPRGRRIAPPAAGLMRALTGLDAIEAGLRKWSMPTLGAIGDGARRFGEVTERLGSATDRAASIALRDLERLGLIERRIGNDRPPHPVYAALDRAESCLAPLRAMRVQAAFGLHDVGSSS
ncbi:MAG: winged helix-turn-helix transcriptional regulator [Planctomycetota bacterium]